MIKEGLCGPFFAFKKATQSVAQGFLKGKVDDR